MLSGALRSSLNGRLGSQSSWKVGKSRKYASFESESTSTSKEVPPQFVPPANSKGDSQTLPLVQKARSLLESRKSGTFTSVSLKGQDKSLPLFGSLMPYVMMKEWPGQPIIALRSDEKHYDHIQTGERASLVVFPLVPKSKSPKELPLPKLNVTATCRSIDDPESIDLIMQKYENVHPGSTKFLRDRSLFHFYAMEPRDVFYVLSTQEIDQFKGADFALAKVDPIARDGRELVEDLNSKFASELRLLCHEYGDVEVDEALVIGIDRLGFDILGQVKGQPNQWQEFRMPLDGQVEDIEDYRAFIEQACKDVRKVALKRTINQNPSL